MNNNECRFESRALEELRNGKLSPALEEHVAACPACRETVELYHWMNGFKEAVPVEVEPRLPTSDAIWENAFKREASQHTKEMERKAMLPILIFQSFAILVSLGIVALFLFPNLGSLGRFFPSWLGTGTMMDSILAIVRSVARSFSYLLIPLGIGISSLLVSGIAVALTPRKNL
jgi:anti-sigma factor RsiW